MALGNVLAAAVALPQAFPLGPASAIDWLVVAHLGVFQIGVAYVFLTRAAQRLPAVQISLLILIEPVLSALLAWAVHGERLGALSLFGCACVLGGTLAGALAHRDP